MNRLGLAVLSLLLAAGLSFAQTGSNELEKTVKGTVEIQQSTQQAQDTWVKERADLLVRYRSAKAQVEYLQERTVLEDKKLQALDLRIAELERRMVQASRLRDDLQDTLGTVLLSLEEWVRRDLPFLSEERTNRINYVREQLARPELTGAEKLRAVLEALQIEAGYGSTVEVNHEQIDMNGERMFVDVLRLGRVSVFWRTPDGLRVGEYSRAENEWVELPQKYNRSIAQAMEMASRMRIAELIALPLGRIQP